MVGTKKPGVIEQIENLRTVQALVYARQDAIIEVLTRAGIDPFDPLTALAMSYQVAQVGGMEEAKKLAVVLSRGVM